MSNTSLPLAAEELIPHRLPLRLIDELLEVDGKSAVVAADVAVACPLVDATGKLEEIALVELIAQGYAALKGYTDRLEQKPVRQGFLVGVKKVEWFAAAQVGDRLLIKIDTIAELDDFVVASGEIWCRDSLIAAGEIKAWLN
ncbi:MAG: hypothetical protein KAU22_01305 [Desulfuromonadales bacterium]|nr:hypothetical protein [Desulfuromonadales bacterium]